MVVPRAAAATFLAAVLLAGCASNDNNDPLTAQGFDDSTGVIQGTVTDDQLAPVGDVLVTLDDVLNQTTGPDGSFRFPYVEPGEHVLSATRPDYASATRKVDVEAGATATINLALLPLPSDAPYHETQVQEGLLGCSFTVEGTFVYYLNCEALYIAGQHDLDRHILRFNIGRLEGVSGWFAETSWQLSQTFARALWINWGTSSGSQPDQNLYILYPFHDSVGPSPHRQRFNNTTVLNHLEAQPSDLCSLETDCNLFSTNYSGHDTLTLLPIGVGGQIQQRFEQYLTTFRNGELPEDFTVLPDS